MDRKIIHCDADCFFVALEMRDDSSLRGIPVAVGGDPGRRGVISTCNYEARAFGVHSAQASAYAKKLCPQLIILPHNMYKYNQAAEMMQSIFMQYTDAIEPLSLDEAFLDVTFAKHFCGSATLIARDIRRTVTQDIGITVSAGIAPNKFLAKVASDWNKPDGLTVVEPSRVKFFLNQLSVSHIPGVGKKTARKLKKLGIDLCVDLLPYSEIDLVQEFGQFGQRLYHFSRGHNTRPVIAKTERRSLSVEHTYEKDIEINSDLLSLIKPLYHKLLLRLQQKSVDTPVKAIFIKLKFMDFMNTTMETRSCEYFIEGYQELLDKSWQQYKKPIRLLGLGVRFADNPHSDQQITLFDS